MKTNRIRWLIPLFLFFGVLFFCSLTVYAAPTAPTSVSLKIQKDGATVTEAARGSKITLVAGNITGGSGGEGRRYEYSFTYKSPSSSSDAAIREYSNSASVDFTISESGTYSFRVLARVADNSGVSPAISQNANLKSVGVSNTSTISSSAVNLGESVTINASATGGTGEYEYKYSYQFPGGTEHITNYRDNAVDGWDLPNIISAENLDKNYTGTITFKIFVRDKNLKVERKEI